MSAARRNTGLLLSGKAPGRRAATVAAGKLPNGLLEWSRRKEEYLSLGSSLQPCIEARQTGRPLAYPGVACARVRRFFSGGVGYFIASKAWSETGPTSSTLTPTLAAWAITVRVLELR